MGREKKANPHSLLIFGAGGQAENAFEVCSVLGVGVVGFVDETVSQQPHPRHHDVTIFPSVEAAIEQHEVRFLFVAIGEGWRRAQVITRMAETTAGLELISLIHPSATVSSTANIGAGSIVMPGAVVGANVSVGQGAIIGANSVTAHDCTIGDFASIFAGVSIGGGSRVGEMSTVGLNAAIREKVTVGRNVVIGAQAFVGKDFDDNSVIVGVPGKKVRSRPSEEKYLG